MRACDSACQNRCRMQGVCVVGDCSNTGYAGYSIPLHSIPLSMTQTGRAYPYQQNSSCLFRQIFCHRHRFTSADGLSRPDKFRPKRTNLQTHRRQNLSRVKLRQNRQNKQNCVKLVNNLSEKLSRSTCLITELSSIYRLRQELHFVRNAETGCERVKMNPGNWNLKSMANYAGLFLQRVHPLKGELGFEEIDAVKTSTP